MLEASRRNRLRTEGVDFLCRALAPKGSLLEKNKQCNLVEQFMSLQNLVWVHSCRQFLMFSGTKRENYIEKCSIKDTNTNKKLAKHF